MTFLVPSRGVDGVPGTPGVEGADEGSMAGALDPLLNRLLRRDSSLVLSASDTLRKMLTTADETLSLAAFGESFACEWDPREIVRAIFR